MLFRSCHVQLSRLYGTEQKESAKESLAEASALLEKFAGSSEGNRSAITRVDVELRRAVFAGFDDAGPQLSEATQLSRAIEKNWPTNPTDFYKLANILAGRNAFLASDVETADGP